MPTLYLAESSQIYRTWFKNFFANYFEEIVDLWEAPQTFFAEERSYDFLIVDEDFLHKGPGPAREKLRALLQPNRISALPILLLERRQKIQPLQFSDKVFKLRRPFHSKELKNILDQLQITVLSRSNVMNENMSSDLDSELLSSDLDSEIILSEEESQNRNRDQEQIVSTLNQFLHSDEFKKTIEESLQKAIQKIVPDIAERMIQDEIKRLTE